MKCIVEPLKNCSEHGCANYQDCLTERVDPAVSPLNLLVSQQPISEETYSQGICGDGAAILKDGQMMTLDEILIDLRAGEGWGRTIYSRGWAAAARRITEMAKEDIGSQAEDDLAKFANRITREFNLD